MDFKVMTWNWQSNANPACDPAKLAAVIDAQDVDVVLAQEVCADRMEQVVTELAARSWVADGPNPTGSILRWHRGLITAPCGPAAGESSYGDAILARVPFGGVVWQELPLYGERRLVMGGGTSFFGVPIRFYTTQISPNSTEQGHDQLHAAADFAWQDSSVQGLAAVFGGDLNYQPADTTLRDAFYTKWAEAWQGWASPPDGPYTFPEVAPTAKIDYLFLDQTRLDKVAVNVPNVTDGTSDHRPCVVTLRPH